MQTSPQLLKSPTKYITYIKQNTKTNNQKEVISETKKEEQRENKLRNDEHKSKYNINCIKIFALNILI